MVRTDRGGFEQQRLFVVGADAAVEIQHDQPRDVCREHAPEAVDRVLARLSRYGWAEAARVDGPAGAVLAEMLGAVERVRAGWRRPLPPGLQHGSAFRVSRRPDDGRRARTRAAGALPPFLDALLDVAGGVDAWMTVERVDARGRILAVAEARRQLLSEVAFRRPPGPLPPGHVLVVDDQGPFPRTGPEFSGATWEPATGRFSVFDHDTVVGTYDREADFLLDWPRRVAEVAEGLVATVERM